MQQKTYGWWICPAGHEEHLVTREEPRQETQPASAQGDWLGRPIPPPPPAPVPLSGPPKQGSRGSKSGRKRKRDKKRRRQPGDWPADY